MKKRFLRIALALAINASLVSAAVNAESDRQIYLGRENQDKNKGIKLDPKEEVSEDKESQTETVRVETESQDETQEIILGRGNEEHNSKIKEPKKEEKNQTESGVTESDAESDVESDVESVVESAAEPVLEAPEIPEIILGRDDPSTKQTTQEASESENTATLETAPSDQTTGMANPFQPCDNLADAADIADFTFEAPSMIIGCCGYEVQAVQDDMIQVIFGNSNENNDKVIVLRKAKGTEDISGDYNAYTQMGMVTVNHTPVCTKGEKNKVFVATWDDGEYSYSIDSTVGMSEAMLKAIAEVMN